MTELDEARDPALELWAARLAGVTFRRPGLALGLWGEAGIGKTHAAQALLRGVPCRSVRVQAAQPLAAVAQALPRPKKPSAWLAGALQRLDAGQEPAPAALPALLAGLLAAVAPVILHVEDLHEAPAERAEVWAGLAQAVARTRGVGLLATSRTPPPAGFEAVRLGPLDRPGSDALLQAEAGATLPPEALAWLFEHAAGNPLFTLEFFRLLARQGSLWNDGRQWRWRAPRREVLPVTVEAVIEQALQEAAQSGTLAEVIAARAMVPDTVDPADLAAVTGCTPAALEQAQAELERRGVLSAGAAAQRPSAQPTSAQPPFAHPLYRELGLNILGAARGQALARRALQVFDRDPEVAAGFLKYAQIPAGPALDLLERAALAAASAGRSASAARFWVLAADQAQHDPHCSAADQARLALRAARAMEATHAAEALRLAQLAARLRPADPETALYLAGRLVQRNRRLSDADEVLGRLPEDLRTGAAWVSWQLGFLMSCGQYHEALALWDASPELHAAPGPATAYAVAGCLVQGGQPEQAAALAWQGLQHPDITPTQQVSLLNVASIASALLGQPEQAEAHLTSALTLAREHGLSHLLGALLQNRTKNLERTERFADALVSAQESFRAYGEAGDNLRLANAGVLVAGHLAEFGRHEEAEALLLDSVGLLERQGASRFLVVAQATLVSLYLDWQPPHGPVLALKFGRAALAQARALGPTSVITAFALAALARAEVWAGDLEAAFAHASEAASSTEQATDESRFLALAALASVHAAQGQLEPARLTLAGAHSVAQAGNFVLDARRLAVESARLAGDAAAAQAHWAWFEARGLLGGLKLVERAFPGLGANRVKAGPAGVPTLRLEVLGQLRVGPVGHTLTLRGRKRQELLARLAGARLSGRAEVSRPDLLDALYPDTPEPQANAALRDVVHQVRAECGAGVIQTTAGGYALGDVTLDAEEFLKGGDTHLWRGPYLAGLGLDAAEDSVQGALSLALRARAEALLTTDPAEAARAGRLLLEADPYDQASLRLTLQALRAGQNHKSLNRTYAQARTQFLEVGERLPEGWAEFLEQAVSAGASAWGSEQVP